MASRSIGQTVDSDPPIANHPPLSINNSVKSTEHYADEELDQRSQTPRSRLLQWTDRWRRAIASDLMSRYPTAERAELIRITDLGLLLMVGWMMARQRGMNQYSSASGLFCGSSPSNFDMDLHRQLCQIGQIIHQKCGELFPSTWLEPRYWILDSVFQSAWQALQAFAGDRPIPIEQLGEIHEQCLVTNPFKESVPADPNSANSGLTPTVVANKRRKALGAFYTPKAIASDMVRQALDHWFQSHPTRSIFDVTLLDPACGSGIFLLCAYEELLTMVRAITGQVATGSDRQHILTHCLHGVDIDPQAVEVTRVSLLLRLLEDWDLSTPLSLPNLHPTICWGDALVMDDTPLRPGGLRSKTIDWQQANRASDEIADSCQPMGAGSDRQAISPTTFHWKDNFPVTMTAGGFDIVVGNPPFVDAEQMVAHTPELRQYCYDHYCTATGNWDLYCIFVEKTLALCRSGGYISLIVPNKLASAPYAATARSLLVTQTQILSLQDFSTSSWFKSAAIYPLIYLAQKHQASAILSNPELPADEGRYLSQSQQSQSQQSQSQQSQSQQPWPITFATGEFCCLDPPTSLPHRLQHQWPSLSEQVQIVGAATVAEAYQIQELIHNNSNASVVGDFRVVNSGTIDRYHSLWGQKNLRYLGQSYSYPILHRHDLSQLHDRRQQQAQHPKLIVAGLSKRLECIADLDGTLLPGKSTVIVLTPQRSLLLRLLAILNSRLVSVYLLYLFSGDRLRGGYLRVAPKKLRQLPMPLLSHPDYSIICQDLDDQVHQRLLLEQESPNPLREARQKSDRAIDDLVHQLYQLSDGDIAWLESFPLL